MANAVLTMWGRRAEKVETGSQSFNSDGTFTAPYTTIYTIVLTGSIGKGGDGGRGGKGIFIEESSSTNAARTGGSAGGGGSSGTRAKSTITVKLKKGDIVSVTVNASLVSFGSYKSVTASGDGNIGEDGGNATRTEVGNGGPGGPGGIGGRCSANGNGVLTNKDSNGSRGNSGLSGSEGSYDESIGNGLAYGATGGSGGSKSGTSSGGKGGDSVDIEFSRYGLITTNLRGKPGSTGADGSKGNIVVSWGA